MTHTSLVAFALVAAGLVALTQCSSSSSDGSTFDATGGSSDAGVVEDCSSAIAFACPSTIPTQGASCNPPNACTSSSKSQTACPYLCSDGQQAFIASCPDGQWLVSTVNDCNPNFDAGPDASAVDASDDAGDGG